MKLPEKAPKRAKHSHHLSILKKLEIPGRDKYMEKFDSLMKRIQSPEIEDTRSKPFKNITEVPHSKPQEINTSMLSTGGLN